MRSPASLYAEQLLDLAGTRSVVEDSTDPVTDWAGSGARALTGRADGPPLVRTGPVVALRGALLALDAITPRVLLPGVSLLGERAALQGLIRQGSISCGGATRLLQTVDGTVGLSLARESDIELVPALVEASPVDPWEVVGTWAAGRASAEVRDRACLLGMAVAVVGEAPDGPPWTASQERAGVPIARQPIVLDLTSLWAGPLAASLLGMLGCRVLKVEDRRRPDGTRRGPRSFFDLLHAGAESVPLDLTHDHGRAALAELVRSADVVLEGSRARALRQLGVMAEEVVEHRDVTWVSITGHGRPGRSKVPHPRLGGTIYAAQLSAAGHW